MHDLTTDRRPGCQYFRIQYQSNFQQLAFVLSRFCLDTDRLSWTVTLLCGLGCTSPWLLKCTLSRTTLGLLIW